MSKKPEPKKKMGFWEALFRVLLTLVLIVGGLSYGMILMAQRSGHKRNGLGSHGGGGHGGGHGMH